MGHVEYAGREAVKPGRVHNLCILVLTPGYLPVKPTPYKRNESRTKIVELSQ